MGAIVVPRTHTVTITIKYIVSIPRVRVPKRDVRGYSNDFRLVTTIFEKAFRDRHETTACGENVGNTHTHTHRSWTSRRADGVGDRNAHSNGHFVARHKIYRVYAHGPRTLRLDRRENATEAHVTTREKRTGPSCDNRVLCSRVRQVRLSYVGNAN